MGTIIQDLRYALRMLRRSPGFTSVAVLTLALGIGASTAIFSVVNNVLLRPMTFRDPDQLVMVWETDPQRSLGNLGVSDWFLVAPATFLDWRHQSQSFQSMAAAAEWPVALIGRKDPEQIRGIQVSANFFELLGVKAALGRTFLSEEDQPGRQRVVLVSQVLWQRRFGGDQNVIGQTLMLNSNEYTVVGILPANFRFATDQFELWSPLLVDHSQRGRDSLYLFAFARLKPDTTLRQANAEMATIARRLAQEYPQTNTGWGASVVSMQRWYTGTRNIRPALLALLGAVGFVLLIACANVASLFLARATARRSEIVIRLALGAGRGRLIRQLLTESALLAAIGGAIGCVLVFWGSICSFPSFRIYRFFIRTKLASIGKFSCLQPR